MHKSVLTALRISSAMLVAISYLALATTRQYPFIIVLLPLVLFLVAPMGERLDRHFRYYRRVSFWVSLAALLLAVASIFVFGLLSSVIALVMYIQVYTLLHHKETRNYHHLFLMSFFLLLAACVMSPEPAIGLVMALFLVSAAIAFIMLQLHSEMDRDPEVSVPVILKFDSRDPSEATPPRAGFDRGIVAAVAGVIFLLVLATAGLFYMTPRMQAGILGRADPFMLTTGHTQTIELAQGGHIIRSQALVMRVEFPDEPDHRFEGAMFWRITSLNDYQLSHWERRSLIGSSDEPMFALVRGNRLRAEGDRLDTVSRRHFDAGGRVVHQSIYMDDVPLEGVPVLTLAERVANLSRGQAIQLKWADSGDYTVLLDRRGARWLRYEAWSGIQEYSQEQLRCAPDDYASVLPPRDYELLMRHNLEPRTQQLVQEIVTGKTTVYDKAAAIGAYLNNGGYFYTLDLPNLPADHPIDAFIHDTKVGHCELFASALALMLRSLGIPTRVVAGYRGGEWSPNDQAYLVREDMAHLWVEVYFIGIGWVTFDPSPPDAGVEGLSRTWIARLSSRYMLRLKMAWYQDVIGFDRGVQKDTWSNVALGLIGFGNDLFERLGEAGMRGRSRGLSLAAVVLVIIVAVVTTLVFLRFRGRAAKGRLLSVDQARAARVYRRLLRKLNRMGTPSKNKTAEEVRAEVRASSRFEGGPILEVIDTYNEVRFGERPLIPAQYARLRRLVRDLRPTNP